MVKKKDYRDKEGILNSVYPPERYLTNGPWIYMVPQFKPKSVLMLGYAGGTTAGLIRMIYGDVPITAIDIEQCQILYKNVDFMVGDAKDVIKKCHGFDVIIVDLLCSGHNAYDFILGKEFVSDLAKAGNYIIINTLNEPDLSEYKKAFNKYGHNKPNRLSNLIYYFGNGNHPDPILRGGQQL